MRIFSDITGKEYKTVEECLAAEKEFEEKLAAKRAQQKLLKEQKDERLNEIKEAYKNYVELSKKYREDYHEPVIFAYNKSFDDWFSKILGTNYCGVWCGDDDER